MYQLCPMWGPRRFRSAREQCTLSPVWNRPCGSPQQRRQRQRQSRGNVELQVMQPICCRGEGIILRNKCNINFPSEKEWRIFFFIRLTQLELCNRYYFFQCLCQKKCVLKDPVTLHRKFETKKIFPEMKLRSPVPSFCINVSRRFIYSHDWSAYFAVLWEYAAVCWEYTV